jgi:hypothetical protein
LASTPRRCMFCLKPGTTDEHVFGEWLRVAFPRTPNDTRTQRVTRWGRDRHGKIYAMPESTIQQGHSGSKKVPYVCAGCNNGWMSRMETRTRRILTPLIQGLPHTISTFDQKYLATWISKTVMVAEYTFPANVAVPDSERLHMLANLEPPPNWKIWTADYRGTKWRNLAISHHMAALFSAKTAGSANTPPDTHLTCMGIGHLFACAVATTDIRRFAINDDSVSDLRCIWPVRPDALSWPPAGMITDARADHIATSLSRIAGIPSVP